MTIPFHIQNSATVTLFGREGRIIKTDGQGYVFEGRKTPRQTERISFEDFERLHGTPDLRIEVAGRSIGARFIDEKHGSSGLFPYLSPDVQVRVLWKKACCDAFLARHLEGRLKRTDKDIDAQRAELKRDADLIFGVEYYEARVRAGDDVPNKKFPSSRTLRKDLKDYESGGLQVDALVPAHHRSGNRTSRFELEELALMMQVVGEYARTECPTKKEAVRIVRDRFHDANLAREARGKDPLKTPCKTTVFNILAKQSEFDMTVRRKGMDFANRKFAFRSKGLEVELPGERVEVDENKLDVISFATTSGILELLPPERINQLEKLRRWLYLYIDCATKCVLSLQLAETPNGKDAVRSLRDVFRDKTDLAKAFGCQHNWPMRCRPFEIIADHGTAFHSQEFRAAAAALGIGIGHPPVGKPHLRGTVESVFRTHNHLLMSHLVGRTFSNTQERGDYPSEKLANLSDDELIQLITTVFVDIYHHQPHEALNGFTPAQRWQQMAEAGTVPVPPDGHEIRAALGREYHRSVHNGGLTLFRIDYECPELRDAYLHKPGQQVRVRADLEDLGWVTVEIKGKRYPARAKWDVFNGMSFAEWEATRREILKRKSENEAINRQTVIDAYARIDATVRRAMLRAGVTPFHISDADVDRTERAMRLTLRHEDPDDAASLPDLINPPQRPTNPLQRGEVIGLPVDRCPSEEGAQSLGRKWEFDDE